MRAHAPSILVEIKEFRRTSLTDETQEVKGRVRQKEQQAGYCSPQIVPLSIRLHQQQREHITPLEVHHSVPRLILPSFISPSNPTFSYTSSLFLLNFIVSLPHFVLQFFPLNQILSLGLSDKMCVEPQLSSQHGSACVWRDALISLRCLKMAVLCMCKDVSLMLPVDVFGDLLNIA